MGRVSRSPRAQFSAAGAASARACAIAKRVDSSLPARVPTAVLSVMTGPRARVGVQMGESVLSAGIRANGNKPGDSATADGGIGKGKQQFVSV